MIRYPLEISVLAAANQPLYLFYSFYFYLLSWADYETSATTTQSLYLIIGFCMCENEGVFIFYAMFT